eukprot:TRINITY_DN7034_c0_g3_i1.p1 TRINITY_DN7034_c0_g3~~TRINITY_DN7034_c0_g3_i1.p1  ORF type:complete len:157 (+),score=16.81 TRINITY_DN7034_c0_g3_i1:696-1166(+)
MQPVDNKSFKELPSNYYDFLANLINYKIIELNDIYNLVETEKDSILLIEIKNPDSNTDLIVKLPKIKLIESLLQFNLTDYALILISEFKNLPISLNKSITKLLCKKVHETLEPHYESHFMNKLKKELIYLKHMILVISQCLQIYQMNSQTKELKHF